MEGGEWSGSGRPSVEVERAIARQELESDKLSNRAGEQSGGTLQDLRFWKTRRAGTRKSRSVGIRKDGTDGEGVSWWERGGRQLSCRVVVVAVVDRFRGILVPLFGPLVLGVTGTVGWQVEVEGQGRGCWTRDGNSHQRRKRMGQIRGAVCGSCSPAASAK